jgi:hypothetical protein
VTGDDLDRYLAQVELPGEIRDPWEQDGGSVIVERHQLVFLRESPAGAPSDAVVQRVVDRDKPPYSREFASIHRPEGLNLYSGSVFRRR